MPSPAEYAPSPSFFSASYNHTARTMASTSAAPLAQPTGYVCDTIPPAKLAKAPTLRSRSPSPVSPSTPPVSAFEAPILDTSSLDAKTTTEGVHHVPKNSSELAPPPGRKLCVRHQRMADEGTNLKLQQVSLCLCCVVVLCRGGGVNVVVYLVHTNRVHRVTRFACPPRTGSLHNGWDPFLGAGLYTL